MIPIEERPVVRQVWVDADVYTILKAKSANFGVDIDDVYTLALRFAAINPEFDNLLIGYADLDIATRSYGPEEG